MCLSKTTKCYIGTWLFYLYTYYCCYNIIILNSFVLQHHQASSPATATCSTGPATCSPVPAPPPPPPTSASSSTPSAWRWAPSSSPPPSPLASCYPPATTCCTGDARPTTWFVCSSVTCCSASSSCRRPRPCPALSSVSFWGRGVEEERGKVREWEPFSLFTCRRGCSSTYYLSFIKGLGYHGLHVCYWICRWVFFQTACVEWAFFAETTVLERLLFKGGSTEEDLPFALFVKVKRNSCFVFLYLIFCACECLTKHMLSFKNFKC